MTSEEVAVALAAGVRRGRCEADECPIADGGDGTMEVLVRALGGTVREVAVHDPLGRPIQAGFALLSDGETALIEMARASGLGLIDPGDRDAEAASTTGTGELIAAALAAGATKVVVTAGGSATTDGGAGAIAAIARAGGLRGGSLIVLCDVQTQFERAAEVYGPQKGASPELVERLTARLNQQAERFPRDPRGVPMTGAAGGLSGGLWATHGAELVPGADWVLDAIGFDDRLSRATAVVTGEGRLDGQTLEGKAISAVARRAREGGVPVHAVAGSTALSEAGLAELGLATVQIATGADELLRAGEAIAIALATSGGD